MDPEIAGSSDRVRVRGLLSDQSLLMNLQNLEYTFIESRLAEIVYLSEACVSPSRLSSPTTHESLHCDFVMSMTDAQSPEQAYPSIKFVKVYLQFDE